MWIWQQQYLSTPRLTALLLLLLDMLSVVDLSFPIP
jgi:hypothetical protein